MARICTEDKVALALQDPWSDAVLHRAAQQATARGSVGDIASVWQDIQRRSICVNGAAASHVSSPRHEWAPDISPVTLLEPPPGVQQVLFEDVFLDTEKRNEVTPPPCTCHGRMALSTAWSASACEYLEILPKHQQSVACPNMCIISWCARALQSRRLSNG